jgi:DNA-binding NarL/FixJ family response regulator
VPHKVLIAEDLEVMRKNAVSVVRKVAGDDSEITEVSTGAAALESLHKKVFDLIILDISMTDLSGIKVAESIWRETPSQKILFWSQFSSESYVRAIGKILPDDAIHGYTLKSEGDDRLAYAIELVLIAGHSFIDPTIKGVRRRLQSKTDALTDIEYETLLDVSVGLTDRAIAQRRHISVRGVQKRISSLLNKLLQGETDHFKESAGLEVLNPRTRLLCIAFRRELILAEDLKEPEKEMLEWLNKGIFSNEEKETQDTNAPK